MFAILKNDLDFFTLQAKNNVHSLNKENCQSKGEKSCFPFFKGGKTIQWIYN